MPNETTDELDADANEVPMRRNPRSSNCKYLFTSGQLMEFRVLKKTRENEYPQIQNNF